MKITNRLLMSVAFIFVLSVSSFAQRGDRERPSPEDMAKRQTEQMSEALELSDVQTKKVEAINLKYAAQAKEQREKAREAQKQDREAMKAAREKVKEAQQAEFKAVLTELQYAKLEGMMEARGNRSKGNRGGKGKKGKKGEKGEKGNPDNKQ